MAAFVVPVGAVSLNLSKASSSTERVGFLSSATFQRRSEGSLSATRGELAGSRFSLHADDKESVSFVTECRKKGIHPDFHWNAKVIVDGEEVMTIGGCMPEYKTDLWSGNHPFYTGTMKMLDQAGRVERFNKRWANLGRGTKQAKPVAAKKAE